MKKDINRGYMPEPPVDKPPGGERPPNIPPPGGGINDEPKPNNG